MAKGDGHRRMTRQTRRRWQTVAVVVGVLVAVVVVYFAYRAVANLPGVSVADQGHRHLASPGEAHEPYNTEPPTSGPHLSYLAPWGVHTRPIARELQVHNLEDGGVLVQYNCECPDLVEKLTATVRKYDKQVILAPYPDMKTRIALTAWMRIDAFDEFEEGRVRRFIEAYRGIDHHK